MKSALRRLNAVTAAAVLLAVCVVGVSRVAGQTALRPSSDRKIAPDFALTDSNGSRIALSQYKGRVVLLDFWATWCTGCKVEIPWYVEFERRYGARGLSSIGVSMDEEGWSVVRPYLKAHPISYPIVLGNPDLVKPYDIVNLPVTLLIDRRGRIADAHVGMVEKDAWEQEIRQLLAERTP